MVLYECKCLSGFALVLENADELHSANEIFHALEAEGTVMCCCCLRSQQASREREEVISDGA